MLIQLVIVRSLVIANSSLIGSEGSNVSIASSSITSNAYDITYFYASFAATAYCHTQGEQLKLEEECESAFCRHSSGIKILRAKRGLVSYQILEDEVNNRVMVVFKGTSNRKEWSLDTNYRLKSYKPLSIRDGITKFDFNCDGCKVHRGFMKGFKSFYRESMNFLLTTMKDRPNNSLYIIGHSLGGALAQLAAIELYLCGYNPIIINYGSPKVANYDLANWMDSHFNPDIALNSLQTGNIKPNTYFRVTTLGDIVPLLPPYPAGFAHGGFQVIIHSDHSPILKNDIELVGGFEARREVHQWKSRMKLLKKHFMKYIKDPMRGYTEFVQTKYHKYYYIRMGCVREDK